VDEAWLRRNADGAFGSTVSAPGAGAAHERESIEVALAASQGRVSGPTGAAVRLGLPRQTLESRIRALRIKASVQDDLRLQARQMPAIARRRVLRPWLRLVRHAGPQIAVRNLYHWNGQLFFITGSPDKH